MGRGSLRLGELDQARQSFSQALGYLKLNPDRMLRFVVLDRHLLKKFHEYLIFPFKFSIIKIDSHSRSVSEWSYAWVQSASLHNRLSVENRIAYRYR
jgi:hypothetical protein